MELSVPRVALKRFPADLNRDSRGSRIGRVLGWFGMRRKAMPKACSSDLRDRVIDAVEEGTSRREAAERFDVSAASAVKWFQAWQREGRRAPKPRGGSRAPLEDHADAVLGLVSERPDWTLEELIVALRKQRIPGSRSALWRFLERHGISFKKKPASGRAGPGRRGPRATTLDATAGSA